MTEKQYLEALKKGLKWMPEQDRREALSDYEAHFAAGISRGKSEEEIAANLGDPAETIRMYHTQTRLADAQVTVARARKSRSAASVLNAVLAGIGLGFLNLIIIVPVFFALAAVVISLYAAAASIAFTGIAVMIGGAVLRPVELGPPGITAAIYLLAGAGLVCLGILACLGCWYLSKYFALGMMKYVELNIDIVRGRSQRRAMKARPPELVSPQDDPGKGAGPGIRDRLRSIADVLDTAAEKTAQGVRSMGRWAAGIWRGARDWWSQFFSKEKEE